MALRDVKNHLSEVVDQVEREHDRVVITKHGRPAAVVVSVDDLASLEETLDIAGRPVPCAVLVHPPEAPYEPATALWLARPFGHLPVRLRTTQANGDTLEHQLQSWPTAW